MPLPFEAIVDTSCFILLDKIDELNLLRQLFSHVVTTTDVTEEFGKELPEWIDVRSADNIVHQAALELEVDKGEASVIALSAEMADPVLILDDLQARKLAGKLGFKVTGTLGIIARARKEEIITSVKPTIEKIRNTNFRFSEDVFRAILKAAGEE